MRIKTSKQMRLDELIKYVREGDLTFSDIGTATYCSDNGKRTVQFTKQGMIETLNGLDINNDTFTVEVEEELTKETVFKELVILPKDRPTGTSVAWNCSIEDLREDEKKAKIYIPNNNKLTLIWSKDTGIPTEGTLEI